MKIIGETIVTGGDDGWLKVWKYSDLNEAEGDDDGNLYL